MRSQRGGQKHNEKTSQRDRKKKGRRKIMFRAGSKRTKSKHSDFDKERASQRSWRDAKKCEVDKQKVKEKVYRREAKMRS